MGYVPITCHVCEGPSDLDADQLEEDLPVEEGGLPEALRKGPTRWLCEIVGVTETAGPSAVWACSSADPEPVVRLQGFT